MKVFFFFLNNLFDAGAILKYWSDALGLSSQLTAGTLFTRPHIHHKPNPNLTINKFATGFLKNNFWQKNFWKIEKNLQKKSPKKVSKKIFKKSSKKSPKKNSKKISKKSSKSSTSSEKNLLGCYACKKDHTHAFFIRTRSAFWSELDKIWKIYFFWRVLCICVRIGMPAIGFYSFFLSSCAAYTPVLT